MTDKPSLFARFGSHEKPADDVSWYQEHPVNSLRLIQQTGVSSSAEVIDVVGGASTLVDGLIEQGFTNLSVLDLSAAALAASKRRLGRHANEVKWIEGDIRGSASSCTASVGKTESILGFRRFRTTAFGRFC